MAELLVVGGGMAGLAAAAAATSAGARVTVVEKCGTLGGSAAMSAGIVWTAPDFKTLRQVVPGGDAALGQALIDGFWLGGAGRHQGSFGRMAAPGRVCRRCRLGAVGRAKVADRRVGPGSRRGGIDTGRPA